MSQTHIHTGQKTTCYHCGEVCKTEIIRFDEKNFCCDGCKLVYDLLKENNLCTYYNLNEAPAVSPVNFSFSGKFAYLDNEAVSSKLIRFRDNETTHITFYVPKIHCSSCIWLLENMHKLNKGVISSSVNFTRKEVSIVYNNQLLKLSEVAELLAHTGYEPLISLNDLEEKNKKKTNREQIIKIGIAGFCFGNIMMLSFPEYFASGDFQGQEKLSYLFGYLNLFLALPVFFYSASEFFVSAWKSIRYKYLNIDAPIALAILVTFVRSIYEITTHTGAGYMDSMSGIVFFMLLGRFFQNRTYDTLSFERDYKSYFPVGVSIKREGKEVNVPVSELKKGEHIIIRNQELIPSDAILLSSETHIDYSFITGESAPVKKKAGDLIYAGGRQLDGAIELEVVNPTSQSYLTQLWNKDKDEEIAKRNQIFTDKLNKYFTIAVFVIAAAAGIYWSIFDSSKTLNAMTAVLIVACPCGLLLTFTFANGTILRIFGRNKFYLKNAEAIEKLGKTDAIVFDKTGTITHGSTAEFKGPQLSDYEYRLIVSLASQSSHPLSRQLHAQFNTEHLFRVNNFEELSGNGIKGTVDGKEVILGSEYFVTGYIRSEEKLSTKVFLSFDGEVYGYFSFKNAYREGLQELISALSGQFKLQLLSGDNDSEKENINVLFGNNTNAYFNQKPENKKAHIKELQEKGQTVMMLGDGLNDAGALKQSDVGIAVSDDTNTFSPACDAILDGSALKKLPAFISMAKANKKVITTTFAISLLYNTIGVVLSVQGNLSPVTAAILMPISSVTIVVLTTASNSIIARLKGL